MMTNHPSRWSAVWRHTAFRALIAVVAGAWSWPAAAQSAKPPVTFTKDILPILQRSCQNCHRPDSIAPMSLLTYEQVRPYARSIKQKTAARQMPPWYLERNVGIQRFKDDPSLSDEEIARIAAWTDSGAPMGNPADAPPPLTFADGREWTIGKPDLIVRLPSVTVKATAPDFWGAMGAAPFGLDEDRYIAAIESKEITEKTGPASATGSTVGGRFIVHHANYIVRGPDEIKVPPGTRNRTNNAETPRLPTHEVGRNADVYPADGGTLVKAGSYLAVDSVHLHSNGRETTAHLEVGIKLFPKGYVPRYNVKGIAPGIAEQLDVDGNTANQRADGYALLDEPMKILTFEPHMHAAGVRFCMEAIYGAVTQTINCAGYNHNWVRTYNYEDDSAPILPKGTILHIIGWFDTTAANRNVADTRNWSGFGYRSIDQMLINLANAVTLTPEQFKEEVAKRQQKIRDGVGEAAGCLTCTLPAPAVAVATR